MDGCNYSVKKSPCIKKWMAQVDPSKEASIVKKMNNHLLLLSSSKTTHCFKEWMAVSGVLKKIYCLYKNLMLQIDPLNSGCSQKLQRPEKKLRL